MPGHDAIIRVRDITVQFGSTKVLDGLDLDVKRGEILGFVGPSGAGKSVLTRTIIGLVPKIAGRIEVFGIDLDAVRARIGSSFAGSPWPSSRGRRASAISMRATSPSSRATASGRLRARFRSASVAA